MLHAQDMSLVASPLFMKPRSGFPCNANRYASKIIFDHCKKQQDLVLAILNYCSRAALRDWAGNEQETRLCERINLPTLSIFENGLIVLRCNRAFDRFHKYSSRH